MEWHWQPPEDQDIKVILSNDNRDAVFHPVHSLGTAALRGSKSFAQNHHYYWEIKITTNVFGTDVMVGVGTKKVLFSDWKFQFCSMLGLDNESWGFSYKGFIQHNNKRRLCPSKFSLGSLLGLHLDTCTGKLSFFVNRNSIGIGFNDLKTKELFPMVSSTAAHSAIRLVKTQSEEATLQMACLMIIVKNPALYKEYRTFKAFKRQYDIKYVWIKP